MGKFGRTWLGFEREADPHGVLDRGKTRGGCLTMPAERPSIRRLEVPEAEARLDEFAAILVDAVQGGASVSFMPPFGHDAALAFWRRQLAALAAGEVVLLAALVEGEVRGSVPLGSRCPPTSPIAPRWPSSWDIARVRGRGLAGELLRALEGDAMARGRTLLTLDTMTGSVAERLYRR